MRLSIASLLSVLFIVAHAEAAFAVEIYLTPDQGYPFETTSDPREIDAIGSPGPAGLVAPVGPDQSSVRFNLWIDTLGEMLTLIGLRLKSVGGAVFTDWDASATLSSTIFEDARVFGSSNGSILTISNIQFIFGGQCHDGAFPGAPGGLPQGSCVGSGSGVPIFDGDPDQTLPMLLGTLTMDLGAGGFPGTTLAEVATGALSSYVVEGGEETPFGPQVMLQAPEPAGFILLGFALAALGARGGWRAAGGRRTRRDRAELRPVTRGSTKPARRCGNDPLSERGSLRNPLAPSRFIPQLLEERCPHGTARNLSAQAPRANPCLAPPGVFCVLAA